MTLYHFKLYTPIIDNSTVLVYMILNGKGSSRCCLPGHRLASFLRGQSNIVLFCLLVLLFLCVIVEQWRTTSRGSPARAFKLFSNFFFNVVHGAKLMSSPCSQRPQRRRQHASLSGRMDSSAESDEETKAANERRRRSYSLLQGLGNSFPGVRTQQTKQ